MSRKEYILARHHLLGIKREKNKIKKSKKIRGRVFARETLSPFSSILPHISTTKNHISIYT